MFRMLLCRRRQVVLKLVVLSVPGFEASLSLLFSFVVVVVLGSFSSV